jgi:protein involved in polysaccharide export with SLBB domain
MGAGMVGVLAIAVGCENMEEPKSFFDPAQVGRIKDEPLVVPILSKLNIGAEEEDAEFSGARDVTQADLLATASDYSVSPNDVLSVSISDLLGPNTVSDRTIRVTQTGKISLPLLQQPIAVDGKTEQQVEAAIKDAYRDAQILQNAQVSVSVIEARGRTYSVLGAVGAPGLYAIYDTDFRLLDALVTARDVANTVGTDTIYVIRKKDDADNGDAAPVNQPNAQPGVDPLAPQSDASSLLPRKSVMLQDGTAPAGSKVIVEGKEVEVTAPPAAEEGAVVTEPATAEADTGAAFEFNALKEPSDREVIKIPYQSLRMGQLKYNIVILPGDLIFVPGPTIGEYYMGGNVQAPGAYSLAARKITLTQAVVAARGLNEVAWPSRTEIVRRLPGDKQVFVKVDLDKIFAGQEPDIYLKPDDRINVGTHVVAPFLAAFRNGFRLTYGFGFLYDRNYGDDDNNN